MTAPIKKKPSGGRKERRVKQRVIISLEDSGDDRLTCKMEYVPMMKNHKPVTSVAIRASLEILKFLGEHAKGKAV